LVGKSDLKLNGLKISGNAEHVYKNRVLHHGTLLFSTNLDDLKYSLNPITDTRAHKKYVRSNPSKVTNISDHLAKKIYIDEFKDMLFVFIMNLFKNAIKYDLQQDDIQAIESLVVNKYNKHEWNFGRNG
jgi:lipoate-protein ligase A